MYSNMRQMFSLKKRLGCVLILLLICVIYKLVFPFIFDNDTAVLERNNTQMLAPRAQRDLIPHVYFNSIIKNYHHRLSQLKQPRFNDSNSYVKIGPPIVSQIHTKLSEQNIKRILLWTKFYGIEEWIHESSCPGQQYKCVISTDRNDLLTSDALLLHPIDLDVLPPERLLSQRWIYFVQEPPVLLEPVDIYNGIVNWTYTYRLDSDILATYIRPALPLRSPLSKDAYHSLFTRMMSKKKRLVVAVISNCIQSTTPRLQLITELQKYIPVDFYGACGKLTCKKGSEKCADLFSEYKFFLTFENSNCRDYITEKPLNSLSVFNAVPIVMGGTHPSDYLRLLPPHSFIHYQGFASAKELAEFLTFLDRNDEMYERYHRWRQTHWLEAGNLWCDMCQALHNTSLPSKVYTDFEGWYKQDTCQLNIMPIYKQKSGHVIIVLAIIVLVVVSLKLLRSSNLTFFFRQQS